MTDLRAVVLVEGNSDRTALHTLAKRRGRDLAAEGIEVVAMGGITNTRTFVSRYGPEGLGVALAGLYDAAEEAKLRNGLAAAGGGAALEPDGLSRLGFYRCTADLEDELIRALGVEAVEAVIDAAGEARSLRLLAGMPAQQGWTREAVFHRFLGSRSGRKARYAALLVEALEPGRAPDPLAAVLARVCGSGRAIRHPDRWRPASSRCHAVTVPRSDSASRIIRADRERVFAALVDADALAQWLPPSGMSGRFERFDARPGGSYRLVLTYKDGSPGSGKATPDSDIVEAQFVDVVPGTRVVQAVDFVSDDPAFAGTMTMTWELSVDNSGTRVEITADDVPTGITVEDHAAGMESSLANLATFVEARRD